MLATLNRYIAWQVFLGILMAFVVITGIIVLIDFVELSRSVGQVKGVSFFDVVGLTLLKAPSLLEEILPFAVLFGAMSALFKLNRRSELIIMRAAGLSAWKFLRPALVVAGLIGIVWMMAVNPLAARGQDSFEQIKTRLTSSEKQASATSDTRDIWLAEGAQTGQTKIYARRADINARELYDVTLYLFRYDEARTPEFTNRFDAKRAQLSDQGYWILTDVVDTPADGGKALPYETTTVRTKLTPDDLREATNSKPDPAFWGLPAEIERVKGSGYSPRPLIMKFNRLLALPLMLIAMTIIAAGASMQLTRLGGALRLMVTGAALGFGVYFANNMITAFGETGSLPSILAAWAVPALVLFGGMLRLSWLEDG